MQQLFSCCSTAIQQLFSDYLAAISSYLGAIQIYLIII